MRSRRHDVDVVVVVVVAGTQLAFRRGMNKKVSKEKAKSAEIFQSN